jgi:hypothetical protein
VFSTCAKEGTFIQFLSSAFNDLWIMGRLLSKYTLIKPAEVEITKTPFRRVTSDGIGYWQAEEKGRFRVQRSFS